MPIIETERLIIRPYAPGDAPALLPILGDPQTMAFWPQPFSAQRVAEWVATNAQRHLTEGWGRCAVLLRQGRVQIGDAGVVRTTIDGTPAYDLGYIIHHPYWRQGYALEAAQALMRDAFARLGVDALYANMATDHTGSRRVAERLGMRQVRTFHNPRNRDLPTFLYRIDRAEA